MTNNAYFIFVLLECPECHQKSKVDTNKLPHGTYRVKCNRCQHKFRVDRSASLNCRVVSTQSGKALVSHQYFDSQAMGWRVQRACCDGLTYDLPGLGTLIRGGLLTKRTPVLPPGGKRYYPANQIHQLQQFFLQQEEEIQNVNELVRRKKEAEDTLDDSKSWYELDCSEFLEQKVKPLMKKDLSFSGRSQQKAV